MYALQYLLILISNQTYDTLTVRYRRSKNITSEKDTVISVPFVAYTSLVFSHPCEYCVESRGRDWGEPNAKRCYGQTQPLIRPRYPGGSLPAQAIVRRVLQTMSKPVYLLDVTFLSQLRKDCHPSVYNRDNSGMDCSHWCVAGLPDTWNQLLYAALR